MQFDASFSLFHDGHLGKNDTECLIHPSQSLAVTLCAEEMIRGVKVSSFVRISRATPALSLDQQNSMGFKKGEYGGRWSICVSERSGKFTLLAWWRSSATWKTKQWHILFSLYFCNSWPKEALDRYRPIQRQFCGTPQDALSESEALCNAIVQCNYDFISSVVPKWVVSLYSPWNCLPVT